MTKQMGSDCIYMLMEHVMKDNGDTIYSMDRAKKCGQMALYMKENMLRVKSMDTAYIVGMMVQGMMENGMKTKLKEWGLTHG
jgi:hypothetical protein